ncbi:phage head closure protein, partial [Klebsiella pneumoniae]|nr:phage head closure protein [Klebsiella pneumoniae]
VTTRITIRYREGVTRKHRILFRGRIYNIEGVLPDPRSGREYLTLPCSEGANDG